MQTFLFCGFLSLAFSVATATASSPVTSPTCEDTRWKDSAMTVLLANGESVLEAKKMVEFGRPVFGLITHTLISNSVDEFVFEVEGRIGYSIVRVGKLTIIRTTIRMPGSSDVSYVSKVEFYPVGPIVH